MAADKPEKSSKEKKAKLTKEKKKPKTTKSASVPLAHPSYLLVCTNFSLPSFCFFETMGSLSLCIFLLLFNIDWCNTTFEIGFRFTQQNRHAMVGLVGI